MFKREPDKASVLSDEFRLIKNFYLMKLLTMKENPARSGIIICITYWTLSWDLRSFNMSQVLIRKIKSPLARSREVYKKIFGKYLFLTNTVSYVALYGLGDALIQFIERKSVSKNGKERKHDFKRSFCVMLFASFNGPMNHFWYSALDKFIKGPRHSTVFKKLFADQLIFAPYSTVVFYMGKLKLFFLFFSLDLFSKYFDE